MPSHVSKRAMRVAALAIALSMSGVAIAENIAVGNYGSSANGMPFADDP